jgi:hypothetical protein
MIVFISKVRLEVQLILLLIGALHQRVLLDKLVLEVFKETIIDFFETQHMLIVVRERNALTDH